jgi:hypothetical protein
MVMVSSATNLVVQAAVVLVALAAEVWAALAAEVWAALAAVEKIWEGIQTHTITSRCRFRDSTVRTHRFGRINVQIISACSMSTLLSKWYRRLCIWTAMPLSG